MHNKDKCALHLLAIDLIEKGNNNSKLPASHLKANVLTCRLQQTAAHALSRRSQGCRVCKFDKFSMQTESYKLNRGASAFLILLGLLPR